MRNKSLDFFTPARIGVRFPIGAAFFTKLEYLIFNQPSRVDHREAMRLLRFGSLGFASIIMRSRCDRLFASILLSTLARCSSTCRTEMPSSCAATRFDFPLTKAPAIRLSVGDRLLSRFLMI